MNSEKRRRYNAQERNKGYRRPDSKARLKALAHERDGGICQLCGKQVPLEEATLDRIDPSARYSPGNVWTACLDCNNRRGDQPVPRFGYRHLLEEKLEQLKRHYETRGSNPWKGRS